MTLNGSPYETSTKNFQFKNFDIKKTFYNFIFISFKITIKNSMKIEETHQTKIKEIVEKNIFTIYEALSSQDEKKVAPFEKELIEYVQNEVQEKTTPFNYQTTMGFTMFFEKLETREIHWNSPWITTSETK